MQFVLALHLSEFGEIDFRYISGSYVLDDLRGLAIDDMEGRSQCLMPLDNRIQSGAERAPIEGAGEAQKNGRVVGKRLRSKLLEQPKQLLHVRQWRGS